MSATSTMTDPHPATKNHITLFFLGMVSGGGIIFGLLDKTKYRLLGLYVAALGIFHALEFIFAHHYHPKSADYHSFLLDHSWAYTGSVLLALTEYFALNSLILSLFSRSTFIPIIGIILVILGQLLRSGAMFSAGSAFTHEISYKHQEDHRLVCEGAYRYIRHPSYLGYFIWSLGTQLILGNGLSLLAYAVVLYRFFVNRIRDEEVQLCRFFPQEYPQYRLACWSGIPGVP